MLIQPHRQEMLSRVYIQAIVSRCGLTCVFRELDYGIDLTILHITRIASRYNESGFKLDVQLKSTDSVVLSPTTISYDLEVKAYDDLRRKDIGSPRILILLVLPAEEDEWTAQTEDRLELRRCAYWLSLRGMAPTPNTKTIRVSIPRANVFSIEALRELMNKVTKRELL
jgi:hypothetical protein